MTPLTSLHLYVTPSCPVCSYLFFTKRHHAEWTSINWFTALVCWALLMSSRGAPLLRFYVCSFTFFLASMDLLWAFFLGMCVRYSDSCCTLARHHPRPLLPHLPRLIHAFMVASLVFCIGSGPDCQFGGFSEGEGTHVQSWCDNWCWPIGTNF